MEIPKLTSAEITHLWNSYLTNTMMFWVTKYFLNTAQDTELHSILEYGEEMANIQVEKSKAFLEEINHPLPQRFDEKDVDLYAPALFSDNFILLLKHTLSQEALIAYSLALSISTRSDVRTFYEDCLKNLTQFINRIADHMVRKGLHHPNIYIPIPTSIEKVDKQRFLAGWFTERRPLTSLEITQFETNFKLAEVKKEVMGAFAQVTTLNDLKKYFKRGAEIKQKHLDIFRSVLEDSGLPQLPTWESEVTTTLIPPFSNRLMLYKTMILSSATAGHYGLSLSSVFRKDLGLHFSRLMAEEMLFGEDGINLMIEHKFLDQLPMVNEK